ncbi:PIN domain-like protein [Daldinia eschscholtzii]|nr:PIN domain-like protein [Daldinia eschscholtzii]
MGLKGFSLRDRAVSQTRSISEWSSEYFKIHGRPLRIAIDQANWWFKNVTKEKEAEIKRKSPGSHPKELRIMERICYLLRMNVQLTFVFDGPNKPWKRRPAGQDYSESNVALLKQLLYHLGVPYHQAPGEAEAECAKMQSLGIVDAVWTEDSDVFMFGCTTMIQFHKPEGSEFKSEDTVIVYTAESIAQRSGLTKEGLLVYAILVGCDYADGLQNIGLSTILTMAKHPKFQEMAVVLANSVSNRHRELSKWRAMLFRIVKDTFPNRNFTVPPKTFPNTKILENCSCPQVSSDKTLRCLLSNWFRPFGPNLSVQCEFLLGHFHSRKPITWPVEYLVPIELNNRLRARAQDLYANYFDFGITEKTTNRVTKKTTLAVDPILVIPELLDIFKSELLTDLPHEFKKVNATLLDCVVRLGLPHLVEKPTGRVSRGRPKKSAVKDNTGDRSLPGHVQKELSGSKLDSSSNPSGQTRLSTMKIPKSPDENGNCRNLGSNDKLKKSSTSGTELPNIITSYERTSKKRPMLFLAREYGENQDLIEVENSVPHKRQKTDISPITNVEVIDLTKSEPN